VRLNGDKESGRQGDKATGRWGRCLLVSLSPTLLVSLTAGCFNAPPPTGPPRDAVLTNAMTSGRLAFERGLNAEAVGLYRQALDRAREMDDAVAIADASYNLGAARVRAGDYAGAAAALLESEAEARRAGRNVADVLLLRARAARLNRTPSEAVALADRVLTDPASRPTAGHRVQAHVLKGEVAVEEGNWPVAEEQARLARDALGRIGANVSPALLGGVVGLRGGIARGRGNLREAARLFDRRADLLRQARLYRDMADAIADSAQAWMSLERPTEAGPRFYRAARAAAAQGDIARAHLLLSQASDAARAARDERLLALIGALRIEWDGPITQPATKPALTASPPAAPQG
jgi:tetratricopeptide (TPR) repeat protein